MHTNYIKEETIVARTKRQLLILAVVGVGFAGTLFAASLTITKLSPTSGRVGTAVTITGTNFGSTQGNSTVQFNGTTAKLISSWSATSINAVVPDGATTGKVVVTVGGVASNGVAFTVTRGGGIIR
jgi:uncharacterized protein (TIGR03437 family)